MELARICAGFSAGQSDRLRQAMTHKRSDEAMAELRDEVYGGWPPTGSRAAADEIWEKLQGLPLWLPGVALRFVCVHRLRRLVAALPLAG